MTTRIIYTTIDGKEFNDRFSATKHECELTEHKWEFFNENMGLQKEQDENSKVKFCKKCVSQIILK
jgi:hypothetical protein